MKNIVTRDISNVRQRDLTTIVILSERKGSPIGDPSHSFGMHGFRMTMVPLIIVLSLAVV